MDINVKYSLKYSDLNPSSEHSSLCENQILILNLILDVILFLS